MPISSSEIAAMNGAYQGQAMNNVAYSGMIGQPSGYYGTGGGMGDHLMGSAMNRGAAVGAPLMMGAMGMMGLDPMSLGLKAGIGAFSGGAGIGGALGAGALAAAPMAVGLAGAAYMGNQFMTGAQGQMQLNNNMRSSFNFQNAYGGQGFSRSDMTQVGGMLRSMTEQFGPGGEVTNFRELSQLTAKMGQMGLAQGVRDVQEFGKKFKEMVTHLKTMAKDLGTTLEGAMEFASAARGSGVFGIGGAAKFASTARAMAVSGGLSMSQVTGAASIGSQISRSIGGTGLQGANAGMAAIGAIGTAQQMGILSEEDIYKVTGEQGAAGQQAYAASRLQRSASFLQSSRGRRVLASIADKDGKLNEAAVQQFLSGGMTIEQTIAHDKENLGRIGRANFIRNEGRLRGAAMERLGAFGDVKQLMDWAGGKGIDVNNMDDRSMLFAQRQLHMGRDDLDQAVKMAQNMPSILNQMRRSSENDMAAQGYAQQRKQMGVEGIKTRFDQARELVNGKLQKVGQDVFNEGSEMLERFMNKLTGQYVQMMSEEADKAYRGAMGGGVAGKRDFETYFGKSPSRLAGAATKSAAPAAGSLFDNFNTGSSGDGIMHYLRAESTRSKYERAGFKFDAIDALPIEQQDAALKARLIEIDRMGGATGAPRLADLPMLNGRSTIGQGHESNAEALLGRGSSRGAMIGAGVGSFLGGVLGFGPGALAGGIAGGALGGRVFGDANERLAVGATMASDQYKRYVASVFSSDDRTRDEARTDVQNELKSIAKETGDEITGRRIALQGLLASDEFQRSGGTERDASAILEKYQAFSNATSGTAKEKLTRALRGQADVYDAQQQEIIIGQAKRRTKIGSAEAEKITNMGIATFNGDKISLGQSSVAALAKIPGGQAVLMAALGATAKEASLDTTDAGAAAAGMKGAIGDWQQFHERLGALSVAGQRQFATAFAGTAMGMDAEEHASGQDRLTKMTKKKGAFGAAGAGLGFSISREERKKFGGDLEKEAALIIDKLGVGAPSADMKQQVTKYLGALHDGRMSAAQDALQDLKGSKEVTDAQRQQREQTAEQKDPFGKKQVDLLTLIARHTQLSKEEIEKLNQINPETKPKDAA